MGNAPGLGNWSPQAVHQNQLKCTASSFPYWTFKGTVEIWPNQRFFEYKYVIVNENHDQKGASIESWEDLKHNRFIYLPAYGVHESTFRHNPSHHYFSASKNNSANQHVPSISIDDGTFNCVPIRMRLQKDHGGVEKPLPRIPLFPHNWSLQDSSAHAHPLSSRSPSPSPSSSPKPHRRVMALAPPRPRLPSMSRGGARPPRPPGSGSSRARSAPTGSANVKVDLVPFKLQPPRLSVSPLGSSPGSSPLLGASPMTRPPRIVCVVGRRLLPDGSTPPMLTKRMQHAAAVFMRAYQPGDIMLLSGARVEGNAPCSEAERMRELAVGDIEHPVPPCAILREEQALNTVENAFYCWRYLQGVGKISELNVVTSEFHMRRTRLTFARLLVPQGFVESTLDTPLQTPDGYPPSPAYGALLRFSASPNAEADAVELPRHRLVEEDMLRRIDKIFSDYARGHPLPDPVDLSVRSFCA